MDCTIEIFIDGAWLPAAKLQLRSEQDLPKGYRAPTRLQYELDYAIDFLGGQGARALSCRYPVNFERHEIDTWPAFVLDLLPSGAARRYFLGDLAQANGPTADWPLLLIGAGNPPGNLRIAEAAIHPRPDEDHPGFDYAEVVDRGEAFIEYARAHGAPVAGSSGAQGDAPKFLLTQDHDGRWHADGGLPDRRAARHWLVKFPRGKLSSDRAVLRNEAAYMAVAGELGIHVHALPEWDRDALFVPRFDRQTGTNGVGRLGLESLCSLCGVSDFGVAIPQQRICRAIARYSTEPNQDLLEYLTRDILNIAMGNTDNHARNAAMLKRPDGGVRLAPLYDFAPMILDDQGIARVCRWGDAETAAEPQWARVVDQVAALGPDPAWLRSELARFGARLHSLPVTMARHGVDQGLIERLNPRIEQMTQQLVALNTDTGEASQ